MEVTTVNRLLIVLVAGLVLGAVTPVLSFASVLSVMGILGVVLLLRNQLQAWVHFAFFLLPLTIALPGAPIELADVGLILGLFVLSLSVVTNKRVMKIDLPATLLLILLGWGVVGYLNGSSFLDSASLSLDLFRIVRFAAYVLLYTLVCTFAQDSLDKWLAVLRFVTVGAAVGGAITGLQYILGYGTVLMVSYGGERVVAPILGSVNGTAVVEATALVIGLTLYITGHWFRASWTWWPTAAALAVGQIVTFSRTAWLGSVTGVFILLGPAVVVIGLPRMRGRWIRFVLAATIGAMAVGVWIPSVRDRVVETFKPQTWSSYSAIDLGGRESFWADAVEASKKHLFLGTGLYSSLGHPDIPEGGTHSQYLAILVDSGVVGVLLLMACLGFPLKRSLSVSLNHGTQATARVLAAGFGAALTGLAIMLFAGEFLYAPQTALFCLLIAGAISVLSVGIGSGTSDAAAAKGEGP